LQSFTHVDIPVLVGFKNNIIYYSETCFYTVFIILSPYTEFLNMITCGEFKKNRRIQIKNGNLSNPETVNTVHIWLSVTGGNVEWCSVSSTSHYLSLGDSGKDKRQFTPAISVICNVNKLRDCSDSDVDRSVWLSYLFYPSHGTVMLWQTETKTSEEGGKQNCDVSSCWKYLMFN
jgi:hypothetical protein